MLLVMYIKKKRKPSKKTIYLLGLVFITVLDVRPAKQENQAQTNRFLMSSRLPNKNLK